MESEDEQKAEIIHLSQVPVGKIASSNAKLNAKQEVMVRSWVRRTRRRCKERLLQSKFRCLRFGILLIVVITAVVLTAGLCLHGNNHSEPCPTEWIGYKKKCYFISEEEKNWTSSRTFCAKKESLLAIFENQEEMQSLARRLKIDDSWIGLRKRGESFYWENGIAFRLDSFQMRNHSECAYLDAFTISTSACSLPRRWICIQLP